ARQPCCPCISWPCSVPVACTACGAGTTPVTASSRLRRVRSAWHIRCRPKPWRWWWTSRSRMRKRATRRSPAERLLTLAWVDLDNGGGAADRVADDQQRLAGRGVFGTDEGQAFGAQVAGLVQAPSSGQLLRLVHPIVPGVQVILEQRLAGVSDVEHHDAAHALQPDEGKGLLSDTAQSDAFRLGPLGVAAAVKAIGFVMTRVEVLQAGNAAVLTEQTLVIGLTGEKLL